MSSDHNNIKLEIDHNKTSRRCSNISKFSYTHLNNSWVKEEITRAASMPAPRIDVSCLTWEGQQFQGNCWRNCHFGEIVQPSIPENPAQHPSGGPSSPTAGPSAWLWASSRPMKTPIMGFHQMFLLKNISDAWVCTNDMLRLALHSFG